MKIALGGFGIFSMFDFVRDDVVKAGRQATAACILRQIYLNLIRSLKNFHFNLQWPHRPLSQNKTVYRLLLLLLYEEYRPNRY